MVRLWEWRSASYIPLGILRLPEAMGTVSWRLAVLALLITLVGCGAQKDPFVIICEAAAFTGEAILRGDEAVTALVQGDVGLSAGSRARAHEALDQAVSRLEGIRELEYRQGQTWIDVHEATVQVSRALDQVTNGQDREAGLTLVGAHRALADAAVLPRPCLGPLADAPVP